MMVAMVFRSVVVFGVVPCRCVDNPHRHPWPQGLFAMRGGLFRPVDSDFPVATKSSEPIE
jgi:hypothetical protein